MSRRQKAEELLNKLPKSSPVISKETLKSYMEKEKAKETLGNVFEVLKKQAKVAQVKLKEMMVKVKGMKEEMDDARASQKIRKTLQSIHDHLPETDEIPLDSPKSLQDLYDTFLSDWQTIHEYLREENEGVPLDAETKAVLLESKALVKEVMLEIIGKVKEQAPGIDDPDEKAKVDQWIKNAETVIGSE